MKILDLSRCALSLCAAAILFAGCSGSQSAGPQLPAVQAPTIRNQKSGDAATTSGDLLYLSYGSCSYFILFDCNAEVAVYTFPGGQQIGAWNSVGLAYGECADGAGNVYVTYINSTYSGGSGVDEILKFAHGSTSPVATLTDQAGPPVACSVDPISGDLAVVNGNDGTATGTLLIYRDASGSPTTYTYPEIIFSSVSYDDKGNVFVDGSTQNRRRPSRFALAKLPKGGNSFQKITLKKQVSDAAELDWDGKYLTTGPEYNGASEIYRFRIRGSSGRFVDDILLRRTRRRAIDQYLIAGNKIIAAYSWKPCNAICGFEGTTGIWHYPSGLVRTKNITPDGSPSNGIALSLAQTHR